MLAMLDPEPHILARRAIRKQLVRDHDARRFSRLSQKFAHEAANSVSIAATLKKDIKNKAVLIDGAPEPMFLAGDRDDDLVQMPFVAALWGATANISGKLATELLSPLADRFVSYVNSAHGEHLFDHSQTEGKAEIEPDGAGDGVRREPMAAIEGGVAWHGDPSTASILQLALT